jgi:hypothetical protein
MLTLKKKTMSEGANQFPIYIPSKGRKNCSMTSANLNRMGISHYVVVEPKEEYDYKKSLDGTLANILVLDMGYKKKYDLLDDLGLKKSTGPGPARNFAWDHSVENGHDWHWTMDDNIRSFYRLTGNMKRRIYNGAVFRVMENFCLRYTNIAMAGPAYEMFTPRKSKCPPFVTNTRIYSCNLIRNYLPFRWRGRYNEDTILSVDMLKKGWCTVQFNAFLQDKAPTQSMSGGNTDAFYVKEGTFNKSVMQVKVHPDISKLVYRFGRVHHHVDYRGFKKNKLRRKKDYIVKDGVNNYGMVLRQHGEVT